MNVAGSDTVVGIVGALVLVAVMAGVFIYEYNNPPAAAGGDGTTEPEQRATFAAAFPNLVADQDIDGDGKANYLDADIDGDNIDNMNDTETMVTFDVSKSFAMLTVVVSPLLPGTAQPQDFYVGNGSTMLMGDLTWTYDVPTPLGLPTYSGIITGAGDDPVNMATSGAKLSVPAETMLSPGMHTLTITQTGTSVMAHTVAGSLMVHYGSHDATAHTH